MAQKVSEHLSALLKILRPLPPLDVLLHDASGCVLAEDVSASADLPRHTVAAYDGYAIRSVDVADAEANQPSALRVLAEIAPGEDHHERVVARSAVRLSSGTSLPAEADAVVALADTDQGAASVSVTRPVPAATGIRFAGEDLRASELALAAGRRISDRQIALLAALGRRRVSVHPRPRVVIAPVGDELVAPGTPSAEGKTFDANGHALATGVSEVGGRPYRADPAADDYAALREHLADQLVRADLIITTGGLSTGSKHALKDVLRRMGDVRFDNVAIAPGSQFGMGTIPTPSGDIAVICLPGDPASAQIGFEVFVRPALLAMAGYSQLYRPTVKAAALSSWQSEPGRRQFVPVSLTGNPSDGYRARPLGRAAQPSISALARANALMVVPEARDQVDEGDTLACLVLES